MTRISPRTHRVVRVPLPLQVGKHHCQIQLYSYFFLCNSIIFLHTISSNVKVCTLQHCKSLSSDNIRNGLISVINTYTTKPFEVVYLHADNKLDINPFRESLSPIRLKNYGAEERVGNIDRYVQTVK